MSYDFKSETEVKEFLHNLGIEYRFGCYSEKNPEVCHLLGDYLASIHSDYKKAAMVYKNNCDDYRHPRSCYKFGAYLLLGKGEMKADRAAALNYFEKGCHLKDDMACLHQGLLYVADTEDTGVKRNIIKGIDTLEKACTLKNANACYILSGMYISGVLKENFKPSHVEEPSSDSYEVQKNMEKAFSVTTQGCNLGNIYCCVNLSQMYKRGEGVAKNEELAEKYKRIALEMQGEMTTNQTLTFQQGLS